MMSSNVMTDTGEGLSVNKGQRNVIELVAGCNVCIFPVATSGHQPEAEIRGHRKVLFNTNSFRGGKEEKEKNFKEIKGWDSP